MSASEFNTARPSEQVKWVRARKDLPGPICGHIDSPTDAEFTLPAEGFAELWRLHSKLNLPTDGDDRLGHL